jgi:phage shock protein A
MSTSTAADLPSEAADDAVSPLIAERAQLKQWLARLDESALDAPAHVVVRVRADYVDRLQAVLLDLTPHVEQLRDQLDRLRESLHTAEARYAEEADELAETRVRHAVGEIGDDEWEDRRRTLEAAVDEAEADRSRLSAELDRLHSLVTDIDNPFGTAVAAEPETIGFADLMDEDVTSASPPAGASQFEPPDQPSSAADFLDVPEHATAPASALAEEADEEELPWIELLDPDAADANDETDELDELDFLNWVSSDKIAESAAPSPPEEEDDEFAFLQELDRAIAAAPPAARPRGDAPSPGSMADGVLGCKLCGATSDARAWYCEGCGEELT